MTAPPRSELTYRRSACQELLANPINIVKPHDMNRATFIEKLTEIQQNVEQLLTQLRASEQDRFAAHLYRSRRERFG